MSGSRCLPVDPSNAKLNANDGEMATVNALRGKTLAFA